jgi:hypothetical protein
MQLVMLKISGKLAENSGVKSVINLWKNSIIIEIKGNVKSA